MYPRLKRISKGILQFWEHEFIDFSGKPKILPYSRQAVKLIKSGSNNSLADSQLPPIPLNAFAQKLLKQLWLNKDITL